MIHNCTPKYFLTCLTLSALCSVALPALAQSVPDAGIIERGLRQDGLRAPLPSPSAPAAPLKAEQKGERITVKRFTFNGATRVQTQDLDALLAGYIGQSLTLGELEAATVRVSDFYRKKGYFARVYLPAQDVSSGDVRIEIIEGRLGDVSLEGDAVRADKDYIRQLVLGETQHGEHYSATRLERGLLLANDLPGVTANGTLGAGSAVGLSDFTLRVDDRPFITGDVGLNNYGVKATNEYQANAGASLNNISGRGDQLSVLVLGSKHLGYGQLGYSAPIGSDGLRAAVNGSYLKYELGEPFEALDAEGSAYTLGGSLRYPFVRSDAYSAWGAIGFDHRNYDDDALGAPVQRKKLNVANASFNGEWVDEIWGGGASSYGVALVGGNLDLSGEAASFAADQAGAQTDGNYAKLTLSFSRDQRLGDHGWYVRKRFSGQLASTNLDSSEKFSLGGPFGVRAYPVNESLGDDGAMLNIELHKTIDAWDLYGFVDTGVIRQYHDTWAGWNAGSDAPNSYLLSGVGLGASYRLDNGVVINALAAVPVGAHQGEPSDNRNQDGTKQNPRLWVGISKYF